MSDRAPEDLRSPREKASKIPSWIMLGFILGALAFYTLHDYLDREKPTPPGALRPGTATTISAPQTGATVPQSISAQPAAPPPLDTTTRASPLLDNSRQMTLFAMDAIFRQWSVNAIWEYDTTQVVFWNPNDGKFSSAVEIFRLGTDATGYEYFYRRIDRPTRPVIRDDTRPDAVILFTESAEATDRRKQKENERWWR